MVAPLSPKCLPPLETAFNKLLGPGAEELGLVIAERARIYRLQNTFRLFKKAQEITLAAGFEPKQVNLKTLLPLMEGASLEDNAELADKWAALLTNAANPTDSRPIKPIYADILRQLTPQDAQVLEVLFAHVNAKNYPGAAPTDDAAFFSPNAVKARAINYTIQLSRLRAEGRELSGLENFDSIIDSLLRQRLLLEAPPRQGKGMFSTIVAGMRPRMDELYFTSMGYDFLVACTPPILSS